MNSLLDPAISEVGGKNVLNVQVEGYRVCGGLKENNNVLNV